RPRARGTAHPPLLPLLAALVALAVVAGAALAGPWHVAPREVELRPVPFEQTTTPPAEEAQAEPPPATTERGDPVTLILAAVGPPPPALLLRALLRRATPARGTTGPPHEPAPGTAVEPTAVEAEPDLPALRRGVAAARAVLASRREPDDAVIAAWLELEAAAARSGVARAPSDTPTPPTTAVLAATRPPPAAPRR